MSAAPPAARAAEAVVGALVAAGVRWAVVCPGSRSAPLALACAARPELEIVVALDERAAAFLALGLGRVARTPAALVVTSGSAGAHALPAAVEASEAGVPLLLLTADRPPELHGCGAPQTTPQGALLGLHARKVVHLPVPEDPLPVAWLRQAIVGAVDAATGPRPGPVHVNAPFREPLFAGDPTPGPAPAAPRVLRGAPALAPAEVDALAGALAAHARGLVLCGPDAAAPGDAARRGAVLALARALGWPVLTDGVSGLRTAQAAPGSVEPGAGAGAAGASAMRPDAGPSVVVGTADALVRTPAVARALAPTCALALGRHPTSKAVARWLAEVRPEVVRVDAAGAWHDPDALAAHLVVAEPTALCEALATRVVALRAGGGERGWAEAWARAEAAAAAALAAAAEEEEEEESPGVGGRGTGNGRSSAGQGAFVRALARCVPAHGLVHVASSLPVRDVDLAWPAGPGPALVASRGANGIDGTVSTAVGEALAWRARRPRAPVVVLTGDLALLHDAGGLALAAARAPGLVVVVFDNGGGGIFGALPVAASAHFERLFLTPQEADLAGLARAYGLAAARVERPADLARVVSRALADDRPTLVHVPLDRAADAARRAAAWAEAGRAAAEALAGVQAGPDAARDGRRSLPSLVEREVVERTRASGPKGALDPTPEGPADRAAGLHADPAGAARPAEARS